MSKLGDSGFEDYLSSSPVGTDVCDSLQPVENHLSNWYLQYGDVGFRIQREKEAHFHPCKSLAHQPQLSAEARCELVSWLISVHKHLRVSFECCCLAVNIMDRFLASTPVAADCFQLLGISALLLATKQVEVCSPSISHLLSLCCDAFSKEQLCNLECLILVRLNFRLAAPTLAFFLDFYSNCLESEESTNCDTLSTVKSNTKKPSQCTKLAQRICELTLADYAFNKYAPSLTACCALTLSSELQKTEFSLHRVGRLEEQWDSFLTEPFPQPGFGHTSSSRSSSPQFSQAAYDSYKHNLAQDCKKDLKLLVSLNLETLELSSNI
uniref:G2/mitotic-specific cyclin-B2 n=2 Tax=Gouania willdenowi TaxID=441366 RepID=A0A8C5H298_GOUWI